jgi:hypothetical protein
MTSKSYFATLDKAIREYVKSEEGQTEIEQMQREMLEKLATTFLRQHARAISSLQTGSSTSTVFGVKVAFSYLLLDVVMGVMADELEEKK